MRPVRRGPSPIEADYELYQDAKVDLVSRLGPYCSYCERKLNQCIHVEHLQPKDGANGHPDLIGRWDNFLLSCVNCNSTKGTKNVVLNRVLLPDRDNTACAFQYSPDGTVSPAARLSPGQLTLASETLALTGLNRSDVDILDANGNHVALDRVSQRMQAWGKALIAKEGITDSPANEALRSMTIEFAVETGFFSVWMLVFADDQEMRLQLIEAFSGTQASGCFDDAAEVVSPAPNPDGLLSGGKL